MRLRDHYDWIVLGDSPGALLSACLTAKLGFSVLVLPLVPGGQRIVYKTRDCVDPESNYLLGLGRTPRVNGILSETFSRLGVGEAELAELSTPDIWPQIITPNFRVTLYGDDRRFGTELARELGQDA